MKQHPLSYYRTAVTPSRLNEMLARPESLGLSEDTPHYNDLFRTWSLGPIVSQRDETTLNRANWRVLEQLLKLEYPGQYDEIVLGHWAVGRVTHLAFCAADEKGFPTPLCEALEGWFRARQQYPMADEDAWQAVIDEDLNECVFEFLRAFLGRVPEPELVPKVKRWLFTNKPADMVISDGQAPQPERPVLTEACSALQIEPSRA